MVLSLPRPRSRWQTESAAHTGSDAPRVRPSWTAERGASRWSATADIAGAFPGFGQHGGIVLGSKVRVSERYLLVDEGRAHGFGLPLAAVRRLAIGAAGENGARPKAVLHLTYCDGQTERSFAIRPRTVRLDWSRDRVGDALAAFRGAGHEPGLATAAPSFLVSWEEARRFRDENVIWSGRATAPVDPLGFRRAGCDVWLTTRSLMWSIGAEHGINRLSLDHAIDALPVDLLDRANNPGLVLGYRDDRHERRDLVLIFDRHPHPERNGRERGAMLVAFRSRGIAPGVEVSIHQPWRRDWWPAPPVPQATAEAVQPTTISPQQAIEPRRPAPALACTRACEADALRALTIANARAIDRYPVGESPDPVAGLGAALAELEAAEAAAALSPAAVAFRRARLLALLEAGFRLDALVRLSQSGQLAPTALEARRLSILHPLNQYVVEPEPVPALAKQAA